MNTSNKTMDHLPVRYGVIGCGRVGVTWARWLSGIGGVPVGFVSRRQSSAREARSAAGGGGVFEHPENTLRTADLVLITTPDDQIEAMAHRLAAAQVLKPGSIALHCSGALASDILAALRTGGVHVGSLHPLQSFAEPALDHNPFEGIIMAGEGDPPAVARAEDLARLLKARFIRLPAGTKTLYHAAAVVASNYLVALLGGAIEMLSPCGLNARDAFVTLAPLVRRTLDNIDRLGIPDALTGPIARGDADTIDRHLHALTTQRPDLLRLYQVLGEYTLAMAASRGGLSDGQVDALHALFNHPGATGPPDAVRADNA